jgi:hypothetical protein
MTLIAGFPVGANIFTIDGLCQDPGAGRFADPPGAAKKESVCQLTIFYRVFQGSGDMGLAHNGRKILGPVLPGTDDEFVHFSKPTTNPLNNLRSPFGDLKRFSDLTDQDLLSCRFQHSKFSGNTHISFIVPKRYMLKINYLKKYRSTE